MDWKIKRANGPLKGEITVPPDKSISHRAIMFSSIAPGKCVISNFLDSEDCMRTLEAFRAMGVDIMRDGRTVTVHGKGLKGLKAPASRLDMGNSGTTTRILSGILAAQPFTTEIFGDASLSRRPMKRIMEPLTMMGAGLEATEGGDHLPMRITGSGRPLKAIDYRLPVASAQVKSCVLAAGLYAEGKTSVTEPLQSRDHTERMMEYFSAGIKRTGLRTEITGLVELSSKNITVPGDISSAAFFIVAAAIVEASRVILRDVGLNPTRTGILDVLLRMGADIRILERRGTLEPFGDVEVRGSALKGTTIEEKEIPFLIDEIPALTVAASMASGRTVIKGVKELRVKETDRVKSVIDTLSRLGAKAEDAGDDLIIHGGTKIMKNASLDSFGDHRIAMMGAIAALVSEGECLVRDTACADTSYPGFMRDLQKLISS